MDALRKPLMVYDGDCSFCRIWIEYWKRLTGDRVEYAPFQDAAQNLPQIPRANFERAVQLILPDGEVLRGAHAVFKSLSYAPGKSWMLYLYENIPGAAPVSEWAYRLVAAHRDFFYRVTWLLWGTHLDPSTDALVRWMFLKALGLIYLIAFISFGAQITGLIGSNGLLPLTPFLQAVQRVFGSSGYWLLPTIFWFNSSDLFLQVVPLTGALFSILLIFGIATRLARIALFLLYLSLVSAGQDFMSFQWDVLLLETGLLAIFLGPTLKISVWLFRWLLFRLMYLSGAAKWLSGDMTWRNLTALDYHFETQPLPTVLGWYFHQLPTWFHQFSVVIMFAIELGAPFLIFAPRRLRFFGAVALVFLQTLIFLTGNYTFFNLLAIALCLFLLDDAVVQRLLPTRAIEKIRANTARRKESVFERVSVIAVAIIIFLVSGFQLARIVEISAPPPVRALANWIEPLHIVNTYGLFSVMTTERPEIIIEGSSDGQNWQEYGFKYKAGDLYRAPLWVEPHQPRLDWQMWFAALGSYEGNEWFSNLMLRLLRGSSEVLALLEKNPFPNSPPRYIRATLYLYNFTDLRTQLATGQWWQREEGREYFPASSLQDFSGINPVALPGGVAAPEQPIFVR